MPRKAAQRKEASSGSKSSRAASSRKTNRAVTKDEEDESQAAERTCRSSTAAQTAASVAESRGTRSKQTKKGASSPSRESSKAAESSASRARSARRSSQNVNYKESDGEEEAPTPKNEEDFESNDEFDESDSDEKNKKRGRKGRSVQKSRAAKPRSRGAPKGRRGRKKKVSDDEDEEEEETVELSDESENEKDVSKEKKDETESKKEEKVLPRSRKSRTASATHTVIDIADSEEKSGRRSRRASAQSTPVEPVSKRPSRNKQVKKYTEVDEEDFSAKSEEDYEPEVKKEAPSKKRKRDSDIGSNKRAKGDKCAADTEERSGDDCDAEDKKSGNDVKASECKTKEDAEEHEEPMEIDESALDEAQSPSEENEECSNEKPKAENKDDVPSKETAQLKSEKSSNKESSSKSVSEEKGIKFEDRGKAADTSEVEKDKIDHGGAAKQETHPKTSDPAVAKEEEKTEIKSSAAAPVEPSNQEKKKIESESSDIKSQDDTFPSKEPAASVNGDDNRSSADTVAPKDIPLTSETSVFQRQNNVAPKTNGSQNELDEKKTVAQDQLFILPNRKHVFNQCISEDLRSSLKQGTFGIVSYNLSSPFINAEKLIHELDKLQASVICLQEVSRSFFNETLESKLDALGYKAIFNDPWSDSGLVTFYKSSLFRLCNVVDTSTSSLISEALASSRLEESEEQAISGCYDKCGNVLITQLKSVLSSHAVTVANIRIPPCSLSLNALQVCCVVRKISTMREHIKPVLICGEFNSCETEVPYQLVKSGYLSERMIDELKNKTDGAECIPLIKLLQSKSGVLSCAMFSCYNLVLGKDIGPPKSNIARDVLWASADNLHIIGVLDACTDSSDSKTDYRISLKADIGFFV